MINMNLEIEVEGLKIKLEFAEKKQVDRTLLAVMHYVQGGRFEDVYDVSQTYVEKTTPNARAVKKATQEVDGIKDYGNGKLGYKCSYRCGCGHTGVRYPTEKEEYVHCHKCNEKLNMMASTADELHDEEFNYFIAY